MNDESDKIRGTAQPSPAPASQPVATTGSPGPDGAVHCFRCGYDLRGLALPGRCSECGLEVTDYNEVVPQPRPSAARLMWMFGWPLLLPITLMVICVSSWLLPLLMLIMFISATNATAAAARLIDTYGRTEIEHVSFHRRLARASRLAVVLFYICGVVPVVCFILLFLLTIAVVKSRYV